MTIPVNNTLLVGPTPVLSPSRNNMSILTIHTTGGAGSKATSQLMRKLTAYEIESVPPDLLATSELAAFRANETVEYDDGKYGLILESFTEKTEFDGKTIDGSDEPKYLVAIEEGGTDIFTADELSDSDPETAFASDEEDSDKKTKDLDEAELSAVYGDDDLQPGVAELDVGWDSFPDSWVKDDRPARAILLDVWTSVGMSFDGCHREMKKHVSRPNSLCASMKDEVYQTTAWRQS